MRLLRHLGSIFWVNLKSNYIREVVYRSNFIATLFSDFVWICVEASLFKVIYGHVESLGGWTLPQVYFFLGTFFASDALFGIFFAVNFWRFSAMVERGELDVVLTKPAPTVFLALTRAISLTTVFNFIFGIGIMAYFGREAGFAGGWSGWMLAGLWLLLGVLTQGLIRFAFSMAVFWTERGWAFTRLYFQFFSIATKPHTIYPQIVRYSVLTVLPFAFIGSIPAQALTRGIGGYEWVWIISALGGFALFDAWLWRAGLRRYQSASS
jgi:ABC-2 type transport system permease protein